MVNNYILDLIRKLETEHVLSKEEFVDLLYARDLITAEILAAKADYVRRSYYDNKVYVRGLIEFTNYCKNDCFYCGIRASNRNASRYRLTQEEILNCCRKGYELGFRTFVLQGGEDPYFTAERIEALVFSIKRELPDCAVTLSVGEHSRETYERWYQAGADRYLLRHETANNEHYCSLHPAGMSPVNRKRCLKDLKEIGYQTGCGFMVGSQGQTLEHLAEDLLYIYELQPEMVGIGPFIPHKDTPMANQKQGSVDMTCYLLSMIRLMLPTVLLPATTALGTLDPKGREKGMKAGANVCMPNLSPEEASSKYTLYNHKLHTGSEAANNLAQLKSQMEEIGYRVVTDRGDHIAFS